MKDNRAEQYQRPTDCTDTAGKLTDSTVNQRAAEIVVQRQGCISESHHVSLRAARALHIYSGDWLSAISLTELLSFLIGFRLLAHSFVIRS
jgi:hypothetical protein